MERSSLVRWLLIGAALFLFLQFGLPLLTGQNRGGGAAPVQPFAGIVDDTAPPADERKEETLCDIEGTRFKAQLTTKGGALKHLWVSERYSDHDKPLDLVTTTLESVMPLRTSFRDPSGTSDQVAYDDFDWTLEAQDGKSCTFVYSDDTVALRKVVRAHERAFELEVALTVTNKASEPKKHRLTIDQSDWRTAPETEGSWGRVAVWHTIAEVHAEGETVRFETSDFEADEFDETDVTPEKWRRAPGFATWSAVSSSFFSKAIFHVEGPVKPAGEMVIEHVWNQAQFQDKTKDPNHGYIYRARLNYGVQELAPEASATYQALAFVGPKERSTLTTIGDGNVGAIELLDLGMFGWIGKLLIGYLYWLFGFTKTWGLAICLLTITVKVLMFPLSISQIKSSMAMRKLKPEMDELNAKYKDDATQRGLAMQELWRKNNVTNPMLGCLPVMLQMPVWFALYTALQTAVELYHTPFLWFPDLSAPDGFYILPILLGASSFLQQLLMPMQGDAMQQKMMKYLMPGMFTVFMLFLPAGLGIYFLTNTWLGIIQQVIVERFYNSQGPTAAETVSDTDGDAPEKKTSRPKRANA